MVVVVNSDGVLHYEQSWAFAAPPEQLLHVHLPHSLLTLRVVVGWVSCLKLGWLAAVVGLLGMAAVGWRWRRMGLGRRPQRWAGFCVDDRPQRCQERCDPLSSLFVISGRLAACVAVMAGVHADCSVALLVYQLL